MGDMATPIFYIQSFLSRRTTKQDKTKLILSSCDTNNMLDKMILLNIMIMW